MWFITAAMWLASKFGVGRAMAMAGLAIALVTATVTVVGVIYFRGYAACASAYELANVKEELRLKTEEIDQLKQAMELGQQLADDAAKAERSNDDTSKALATTSDPTGPCGVGPGWLRNLQRLE